VQSYVENTTYDLSIYIYIFEKYFGYHKFY
jgi:hypothetical protein